jgi:hypothetical protein
MKVFEEGAWEEAFFKKLLPGISPQEIAQFEFD